jgi:hypothetical protein
VYRPIAADGDVPPSADWTADFVWLVDQDNRQIGPLSTLQMALAAKNGLIAANALIWRDGLPRWFAADEIAGLLPENPPRQTWPAPAPSGMSAPKYRSETVERLVAEHAARRSPPLATLRPPATGSDEPLAPQDWARTSWASAASPEPLPTSQAEAPFERLRAILGRWDDEETPGTMPAAATTGEMLPALRHYDRPLMPATSSVTETLARHVAESIVLVLERHRIKSIDDLATGDRLRQFAVLVVDNLPGTVRLGLGTTIGRAVIEAKIVELFEFILFNIPRHHRQRDLRDVVADYVPQLARALEDAVAATASKVGSFVMSNISQAVSALRRDPKAAAPGPLLPARAL